MDYLPFLVPVVGTVLLQGAITCCVGIRARRRHDALESEVAALRGRVAHLETAGPNHQTFLGGYTFAQPPMPQPSAPPPYRPPPPQVLVYR